MINQNRVSVPFPDTGVALTASPAAVTIPNEGGRGVRVTISLYGYTAGGLTVSLYGKDTLGNEYLLLASASIGANGLTVLVVYPGLTAVGNLVATNVLGRQLVIKPVHADTNPLFYSIAAELLP